MQGMGYRTVYVSTLAAAEPPAQWDGDTEWGLHGPGNEGLSRETGWAWVVWCWFYIAQGVWSGVEQVHTGLTWKEAWIPKGQKVKRAPDVKHGCLWGRLVWREEQDGASHLEPHWLFLQSIRMAREGSLEEGWFTQYPTGPGQHLSSPGSG